jgi:hypothetical protein
MKNTIDLVNYLMRKYGLTIDQVYRHNDITGKICPAMMISPSAWDSYRTVGTITCTWINYIPWTTFKDNIVKGGIELDILILYNGDADLYPATMIQYAKGGVVMPLYAKTDTLVNSAKVVYVVGSTLKVTPTCINVCGTDRLDTCKVMLQVVGRI